MANNQSIADELQKLSDLKEKGVITEEEFNEQKARLLQRSRDNLRPSLSPLVQKLAEPNLRMRTYSNYRRLKRPVRADALGALVGL